MRDLYMKNGQGFVLVYSITSQASFNDVTDIREQVTRVKERNDVSHVIKVINAAKKIFSNEFPLFLCMQIPMVLVGNKCDLEDERVVGREQGQNLARQWGNT